MTGRRRTRAFYVGLLLAPVAIGLSGTSSEAAPKRRDAGPLYTQIDTGQGAAATARALAARGDCAGALASFDVALRSSIDATLRRDRGYCHEALHNPFPAMDDYRAYLTAAPDAPDANDVRLRLEKLETETGVGGPSANPPASTKSAEDVPDEKARIGDVTIETSDTGRRTRQTRTSYDAEEDAYKKYDRAMTSPLRRGTGGIFGLYGSGLGVEGLGAGYVPGGEVGVRIGWSFSQVSAVYGQVGYANYQLQPLIGSQQVGGVALTVGYEARIRLDQYATHAIIVSPAFEYQYVSDAAMGSGASILIPQGRVGYRAILGYGFGIELLAIAGEPIFALSGGPVTAANNPVLGGSFALLLAF